METLKTITTTRKIKMNVQINILSTKNLPWSKTIYHCEIVVNNKSLLITKPISKDFKNQLIKLNSISYAITEIGIRNKIKKEDKKIFNLFKSIFYN